VILLYVDVMRSYRLAAGLAATAFVLGACSGGDSLDPDEEADLLEDAILTDDDVPDGFEESDPSDDDDDETLDDCLEDIDIDADALDDSAIAEVDPVAFSRESADEFATIEAELRTVDPTGPAEDVLEAFGDDDFRDCVLDGFAESAEDDGQALEDAELDEVDVPFDGDATGGLEFTGSVSGFDFTAQILVVLEGNHLVSLELTSINDELDDDDVEAMFEAMVDRLEAG
jgi:hypothetical protein